MISSRLGVSEAILATADLSTVFDLNRDVFDGDADEAADDDDVDMVDVVS